MDMRRSIATVSLGLLLIAAACVAWSCQRAIGAADAIMSPLLLDGWIRGRTRLLPVHHQDAIRLLWRITYEKTNSNAFIHAGPEIWVTLSGQIALMNPTDLKQRSGSDQ